MNLNNLDNIYQEAQQTKQQADQRFESTQDIVDVIFPIVGIVMALTFVFILLMIFSSKFRGKIMAKQIKAVDFATTKTKKNITNIAKNTSGAVEVTTKAFARGVKKGLK